MKPLSLITLIAVFILIVSPIAKACEVDMDQVFIESINRECVQDYFRCIAWEDLPGN